MVRIGGIQDVGVQAAERTQAQRRPQPEPAQTQAPAAPKPEQQQRDQRQVTREQLEKATEKANQAVKVFQDHLEFKVHEATGQVMVKIVDNNTGEVLREIPPEKLLDMAANLMELAGILVDKRV
jgi:flagellar protein FlaG